MAVELLYFANPMCSWCWGFAPVVRALAARERVTLALGALGRGDRPMRPEDKAYVREHWEHVAAATGQPFDFAFFDRNGFVYDTEPACRAVATVRALRPELALAYLEAVQEAFYAENRDVTDAAELRAVAAGLGVAAESFAPLFAEPETRAAVARELAETAALGVTGYPTLLGLAAGRAQVLSLGCRPLEEVERALAVLRAEA